MNTTENAPGASSAAGGSAASEGFAYIGIKRCGCIVAATVDDGKYPESTADDVRDFIKSGYRIERVPLKTLELRRCNCAKPPNVKVSDAPHSAAPNRK